MGQEWAVRGRLKGLCYAVQREVDAGDDGFSGKVGDRPVRWWYRPTERKGHSVGETLVKSVIRKVEAFTPRLTAESKSWCF